MAEQKKSKEKPAFADSKEASESSSKQDTKFKEKSEENQGQNNVFPEDDQPHFPARSTGLCAIASLFLVLACLFLIRFETNRISSLRIDAGTNLTQEEILAIVGDIEGKYLPSLDTETMEKRIKELSPMVADVRFDLSFTRVLTVRIVDEKHTYSYRTESGGVLLLNDRFKALGYHPEGSCKKKNCEYEKGNLTELYIKDPTEIEIGKTLIFDGKDELADFVKELTGKKGKLYKKLNLLDIRNARHLVFIFDNLVCVELSEASDFEIKCTALEKMMDKRKTREEEIETRFTYVDPVSGSIYWAVEEWANLYEYYPNPDRR